MLPCGVGKMLIRYHVAWVNPNLCFMWRVIYSCHMAWPKLCLIVIWHVLDIVNVSCDMGRLNLGAIWHG